MSKMEIFEYYDGLAKPEVKLSPFLKTTVLIT